LLAPLGSTQQRPSAQLDGSEDLRRLDRADALETTQFTLRLACQSVHAAHHLQDVVCYVNRA
jgi:hypothetical protein